MGNPVPCQTSLGYTAAADDGGGSGTEMCANHLHLLPVKSSPPAYQYLLICRLDAFPAAQQIVSVH